MAQAQAEAATGDSSPSNVVEPHPYWKFCRAVESPTAIPATPCLLWSQLASKPPQGPVKLHLKGQFT